MGNALVLSRAHSLGAIPFFTAPPGFEAPMTLSDSDALRCRPKTLQAPCVPPRWPAAGPGAAFGAFDGATRSLGHLEGIVIRKFKCQWLRSNIRSALRKKLGRTLLQSPS